MISIWTWLFCHLIVRNWVSKPQKNKDIYIYIMMGAVVAEWLSSWLAEQEDRGSIPGLPTRISEIGYLLAT